MVSIGCFLQLFLSHLTKSGFAVHSNLAINNMPIDSMCYKIQDPDTKYVQLVAASIPAIQAPQKHVSTHEDGLLGDELRVQAFQIVKSRATINKTCNSLSLAECVCIWLNLITNMSEIQFVNFLVFFILTCTYVFLVLR